MKKNVLMIVITTIILWVFNVRAETTGYLSLEKDEIQKDDSFIVKVTLEDVASWNIHVVVDGEVDDGCIKKKITLEDGTEARALINEVDVTTDAQNTNKEFTTTCTAPREGVITLTLIGDVTSTSGENVDLSEMKTIIVGEKVLSGTENNDSKVNPSTGAFLNITLIVLGGGATIGLMRYISKRLSKFKKI